MNILLGIIGFALAFVAGTSTTRAVPPPDFIFNVGSQLVQVFSIVAVFLSAAALSAGQFLKAYFHRVKHKKIFWMGAALVILAVSFGIAYGYQQFQQQAAYREWIAQSTAANQQSVVTSQPFAAPMEVIKVTDENSFFENNQAVPTAISNADFQSVLNTEKSITVLDARENEEYEIGNFPNSLHIRFADLLNGRWRDLPKDQVIYVFCWSGMRGKDVTDFLRSKKILARYIEKGASDWVASGGTWSGDIKFSSKYPEERYSKLFDLAEMKDQIAAGTMIIDSRPKDKFEKHHISGSINIPIIYTSSENISSLLAQIPAGKKVITVCDDFISCFDAKIVGVKVGKNGADFLGRYNKPWAYQN